MLINPEGSPILHFLALCDFFERKDTKDLPDETKGYCNGRETKTFSFSSIVRLFLKKIFLQRVTPATLLMFCNRMHVRKSERVPPAREFGPICGLFWYCRREYFEVLLLFLSPSYGADLGHSRPIVFNQRTLLISLDALSRKKSVFGLGWLSFCVFGTARLLSQKQKKTKQPRVLVSMLFENFAIYDIHWKSLGFNTFLF